MYRFVCFNFFILPLISIAALASLSAQKKETSSATKMVKAQATKRAKNNWVIKDLRKRSNDQLMIQFGYHSWMGAPDSLNLTGFSNYFSVGFLYDIPFKSNPHFSIAPGLSFSWNSVYFDKVLPQLTSSSGTLNFANLAGKTHYEIQRMSYNNLEALVEFRYISNPERSERSFKVALGLKFGLVVDAYTHLTNQLDKDGKRIQTGTFTEHSTRYLQFPQSSLSLRIGYGVLSVITSYNVGALFNVASKAPAINPLSIGLVLSGL